MWVSARHSDLVFKLQGAGGGRFVRHVYDHATDPNEERDLYDPTDATHATHFEELKAYKATLVADYEERRRRGFPRVERETRLELLRELGYIQ